MSLVIVVALIAAVNLPFTWFASVVLFIALRSELILSLQLEVVFWTSVYEDHGYCDEHSPNVDKGADHVGNAVSHVVIEVIHIGIIGVFDIRVLLIWIDQLCRNLCENE